MVKRCEWCEKDALYRDYHDKEWGKPVHDERLLFEYLVLESFQSGLSWYTILKKRANFRVAFDNFNYYKIANYSEDKINELLNDKGIVRHQLKIRATIENANQFIKIQKEFESFDKYIWGFTNYKTIDQKLKNISEAIAKNDLSYKIAKDLKKRGFKFLGSTTVYSYLQAIGVYNDHLIYCDFR